ncbi:MAG: SpoIIE family protein phosphatase [candidate division Zixibacteria bacterium]|nr:SpoIIE family protein phosphatase [candidate division Zixibacteria bacterium]
MRILVVDDDPDIQRLLARILHSWEHEVVTANNGQEALAILEQTPIRFVISDWMMPEMDGLELCHRIRNSDLGRYIYLILLTARDAKNDLIHGMEAGADDFVVNPFNRGELKVRIRAGERILALEQNLEAQNARLQQANEQVRQAYECINRDLEAGAEIQRSLLPPPDFKLPGFNVSWSFSPSALVAGDIFNLFQLDEQQVGFYLLDVAGHGVPSAMLSVTLSRILSPIPDSPLKYRIPGSPNYAIATPANVLKELNQRFPVQDDTMQYFTMVYGIVNRATQTLTLSPGGHPPSIFVSAKGKLTLLGLSSMPIGLWPETEFETEHIRFCSGDRLYLYSDGIPDCFSPDMEPYSQDRMVSRLVEWRKKPLEEVTGALEQDLRKWRGRDGFSDDLTLLALEMI